MQSSSTLVDRQRKVYKKQMNDFIMSDYGLSVFEP